MDSQKSLEALRYPRVEPDRFWRRENRPFWLLRKRRMFRLSDRLSVPMLQARGRGDNRRGCPPPSSSGKGEEKHHHCGPPPQPTHLSLVSLSSEEPGSWAPARGLHLFSVEGRWTHGSVPRVGHQTTGREIWRR